MEGEAPAEMMAAEEQPMMMEEEKPQSDKPKSEKAMSEKAMSEKAMSQMEVAAIAAAEVATAAPEEEESEDQRYCIFCCCLCHCSDREYRDLTCLGCFPVKCGIYAIGLLAVFLTVLIFAETFMMLMSEHIAWWFVLVSLLLQIPLIIGLIFFLNFFGEDSAATRGKLRSACIMAIVSFSLQVGWNIGYFWGLFRQQNITIGNDESFTFTTSKKQYLFWTTFFYLWASFAFGYFICVVGRYAYRLRDREEEKNEDEEMTPMMGDDANEEKANN